MLRLSETSCTCLAVHDDDGSNPLATPSLDDATARGIRAELRAHLAPPDHLKRAYQTLGVIALLFLISILFDVGRITTRASAIFDFASSPLIGMLKSPDDFENGIRNLAGKAKNLSPEREREFRNNLSTVAQHLQPYADIVRPLIFGPHWEEAPPNPGNR